MTLGLNDKNKNHLSLPDLTCPALYTLATTADLYLVDFDALHTRSVLEPVVSRHTACIGSSLGYQLQHGREEVCDALSILCLEVVFLTQYVRQRPMPQAVDVTQFAFSVENLLRPFAG